MTRDKLHCHASSVVALLSMATCCLLGTTMAWAQGPAVPQSNAPARPALPSFVQKVDDTTHRIDMIERTSRRLTLAEQIPEVIVNNPEVISATPVSPNEVQISALQRGVTQLTLRGESGAIHTIDIIVMPDATEVNLILKRLYPRANLEVVAFASSAVVTGYTDDPTIVMPIMQTVQNYFPTAINGIQVGGVQQVMLKVKVLEVSRTKLRTMGVDLAAITSSGSLVGTSVSGLLQAATLTESVVASSGAQTFQLGVLDGGNQFFAFIEALQEHRLAKVLAEPNVTTISGRPANFNAGGEIPILVPQSLGTVSIEYRPYGTQVDFVPIIRNGGIIRLEVRPRISEIDNARSVILNGNSVPALRVSTVETGVEMRAGQTLAIAGLVQTRTEATSRGLPWISDIPYLGAAFRRVRDENHEVELLILVTPHLVNAVDHPICNVPGIHTMPPSNSEFYLKGQLEVPATHHQMLGDQGQVVPMSGEMVVPQQYGLPPQGAQQLTPPQVPPPSQQQGTAVGGPASSVSLSPGGPYNPHNRATPAPVTEGYRGGESQPPGLFGPVGYDVLK